MEPNNDFTIGIGLTTFNRPECRDNFLAHIGKFPPYYRFRLYIAEGIDNIAKAKNECLKKLEGCDFFFLCDDDVFFIKEHWDKFFIDSGYKQLLYMNDGHQLVEKGDSVSKYKDASGCFIFLTKEVFENVGYFNEKYGQYGYEHIGFSTRINKYLKEPYFLCLNQTNQYLYSLDLQGDGGYRIQHNKLFSDKEKSSFIDQGREIFLEEINSEKIYYKLENDKQLL